MEAIKKITTMSCFYTTEAYAAAWLCMALLWHTSITHA